MRYAWIAVLMIGVLGCDGSGEQKLVLETQRARTSYGLGVDVGFSLKQQWGDIDAAAFARGVRDGMADKDPSYALGMDVGRRLRAEEIDADPDILARGAKDAASGVTLQMEEPEIRDILVEVRSQVAARQQELAEQRAEEARVLAEENRKAGEEFLAANVRKKGVIKLPSGLQYKVIRAGAGKESPALSDTVIAGYWGKRLDGAEFDGSERRGGPMDIPLKAVIRGWKEALQLMTVGDKWEVYVPANLAYGTRGYGQSSIGPNEVLIFEIELFGIKKGTPEAQKPEGGR